MALQDATLRIILQLRPCGIARFETSVVADRDENDCRSSVVRGAGGQETGTRSIAKIGR